MTASRVSSVRRKSRSGYSGATTRKVAPIIVSGRVVKTLILRPPTLKSISAPMERPIQFFCMVLILSGQSRASISSSNSSAYSVILKNHCFIFFFSTS